MEGRLEYDITASGVTNGAWLNLAHDCSAINSKGMNQGTAKGELLTYVCDISFVTTGTNSVNFYAAKENWVTKNAWKKWHALREFMFKESGISKRERGRYGSSLRVYLDPEHAANEQYTLTPVSNTITYDAGTDTWEYGTSYMSNGNWTFSDIVVETNPDSSTAPLETDQFSLNLCGPHSSAGAAISQQWTSCGMIQGYMADRVHPTAEPDDPVDYRDNPLALLRGRSESVDETLAIAAAQAADGPPYDTDSIGEMTNPQLAGFLSTTASGQQKVSAFGVRLPAGLCYVQAAGVCELTVTVRRVEVARG